MSDWTPAEEPPPADSAADGLIDRSSIPPADAFGVLGNRIRLSILRTLWEAPEQVVSFAELKRRVPSDTQNFDYHLKELVGPFVRQTDDGYALCYAGKRVMQAITSGIFTDDSSLDPIVVDSSCPFCGSPVELQFRDGHLTARCTHCGGVISDDEHAPGTLFHFAFPPSGLSQRRPNEALEAATLLSRSKFVPMMDGICPECAGDVGHVFTICDSHDLGKNDICQACDTRFRVWAEFTCDRCGYCRIAPPWVKLVAEPAVIAFSYEHGDVDRNRPCYSLLRNHGPDNRSIVQTVLSRDPLRIQIVVSLRDAELRATVNDELEIIHIERVEDPGDR